MTKEEAKKYIDSLPYETSGIVVFSLEDIISRENAAEMGGLTDENDPKVMEEAAKRIMEDYSIKNDMDDTLGEVIQEFLENQTGEEEDDTDKEEA